MLLVLFESFNRLEVDMDPFLGICLLLVVGVSQSAPQQQQDVVRTVLNQLTPQISETIGSLLGQSTRAVRPTIINQFPNSVNNARQTGRTNLGRRQIGRVTQSIPTTRGISASQITSDVVSSLQPSIAAAVAEALRKGGQTLAGTPVTGNSGRGALTLSPEEEAKINAELVSLNRIG